MGTYIGNPRKLKKQSSPPPNLKGKKARHLDGMLGPSHWLLHEISLPKRVSHHFWPGLKEHLIHYKPQTGFRVWGLGFRVFDRIFYFGEPS